MLLVSPHFEGEGFDLWFHPWLVEIQDIDIQQVCLLRQI
jgi:hypothetical protein